MFSGRRWTTAINYSTMPVKFAYQYLGQVNAAGQSIPLQIIIDNLKSVPQALITGFPLLVIGIPRYMCSFVL